MAHNIFGSRFVGARTAAWHNLGTVIPADQTVTVEDALKIGKIDFLYHAVPMGYTLPSGDFIHSGDRQVILREPTADSPEWVELGVVSDGYRFIQNADLARGLDALAQQTGWKFETVGALGKGETVFLTLRTGQQSVFGDDFDTYVVVSDGKCANRALQIAIGNVRIVCQNTLMVSDSAALSKIRIAHDEAVEGEFQFWIDMIGQLQTAQDEYFQQLERLASFKISQKQAGQIVNAAYPMPAKSARTQQAEAVREMKGLSDQARAAAIEKLSRGDFHHEWWAEQTKARREAALTCYKRLNAGEEEGAKGGRVVSPETLATISETPYAALQAVAEVVDWGGRVGASQAAASSLFGDGAKVKDRAFKAAMKLAV